MLTPALGDVRLLEVARVEGGLVNTVYRVTVNRRDEVFALRVYAADRLTFQRETSLLSQLSTSLPVPEVVYADASGQRCVHPYLVYRWIEGINLNECRKESAPQVFLSLAGSLGQILANVASIPLAADCADAGLRKLPVIRVEARLRRAEEQLHTGLGRQRLDEVLADSLSDWLNRSAPLLEALEGAPGLVHGDLGGRNILVRATRGGEWAISGLIDWEQAATGSGLWDVGSLFRYGRRYPQAFRTLFEQKYRAAGGVLPPDWWPIARLLDATRLVGILYEEREMPAVIDECRELIRSLIVESYQSNNLS